MPRAMLDLCRSAAEVSAAVDLCDMLSYKDRQAVISYRALAAKWGGSWNVWSVRRFIGKLSAFVTVTTDESGKTRLVSPKSATPSATLSATPSATPKTHDMSDLDSSGATPSATRMQHQVQHIYNQYNTRNNTLLTESNSRAPAYTHTREVEAFAELYGPGFDFGFVDDGMAAPFLAWLTYKAHDLKFRYMTQSSLQACYRELVSKSGGDAVTAQKIVDQSVSNGWKGLFNLKQETQNEQIGNGYYTGDNARFIRQAAEYIASMQPSDDSDEAPF